MICEFFILSSQINRKIRQEFNNEKDLVLDLGCGSNPKYHKEIKGKIVCLDLYKTGKTHLVADADKLPFKPNSFDKMISINSFYYFKNPFDVAKNLSNILKKNGTLFLVVPFFYPIHDVPYDKYRFSEHGIGTVFEEYFEIKNIKAIGGIFSLPSVILHSAIKGIPLVFDGVFRNVARMLAYLIFYAPYILSQFLELLNIFDKTKRVPVYYVAIMEKK